MNEPHIQTKTKKFFSLFIFFLNFWNQKNQIIRRISGLETIRVYSFESPLFLEEMLQAEIIPGKAVGSFFLGLPLRQAIEIIQKEKKLIQHVELYYNEKVRIFRTISIDKLISTLKGTFIR